MLEEAVTRTAGSHSETRAEYEALAPEFAVASAIIARLESGRTLPSIKTLLRVAKATGTKPKIRLVAA
ncbi:MAG: hypothetical protein HQL41_12050 [Alphaproteobacteria bacterium]|nr:hypothetical protein [Alphaproteobacteria bacterium]